MEFGIVYTASEGAFQMEVFTGEVIAAECRENAMHIAESQAAHPYQELAVHVRLNSKAHIQILPGPKLIAKTCVYKVRGSDRSFGLKGFYF